MDKALVVKPCVSAVVTNGGGQRPQNLPGLLNCLFLKQLSSSGHHGKPNSLCVRFHIRIPSGAETVANAVERLFGKSR